MITDGKLFYKSILDKLLTAIALHKVILNQDNKPVDYEFIEVNEAFEDIIGIKTNDIIRTKCSDLKFFKEFNWKEYYDEVIFKSTHKSTEYYSERLHRWYQVDMYSPEPNYVITIFNEITMLKLVEDRISDIENKYRRLVEIANEGIFQLNENLEIVYLNNQMAAMLGYTRDEMLRKKLFKYLFEEDYEAISIVMKERKQGKYSQVERRFKHKKGFEVWTLISGAPIFNKDKSFCGSIAMIFNITDRKVLQEEFIKTQLNLQSIINNASDDLIILLDTSHNFIEVNESFLNLTELKREDIIGKYANDYMPVEVKRERNKIIEKVKYSGEPVTYEDHARGKDWLHTFYPVKDDSGNVINIAIFSKDVTERNKVQKELLINRLNLKGIINALEFVVIQVDLNNKIIEVNDYFCKRMNKERDEIINTDLYSWFADNVRESRIKLFEKIKRSEEASSFEDKSRNRFWFNSIFPVKDENGKTVQFVIFQNDITESKRMERQIKENEQRFRSFFVEAPYAINLFSNVGKIKIINPEFTKISGYTTEDIKDMYIYDLPFPEDKSISLNRLKRLEKDDIINEEARVRGKNGNEIFVELELIKLSDDEFVSFWKDITDKKKIQEELIKTEERFRAYFELSPVPMVIADKTGNVKQVNNACIQSLGYSQDEQKSMHIFDILTLDSYEKGVKHFESLLAEGNASSEISMKTKSGKIINILLDAKRISEDEYVASWKDITDRQRLEKDIKNNEIRFRSYFESSPNPILVLDKFGRIINSNKASHKTTGYTDEEVLNMSIFEFISEKDANKAVDELNKLIKTGTGRTELCVKYKNNKEVPVLIDGVRLSDNEYICFWTDISFVKKAQDYKYKEKQYSETIKLAKIGSWTSDVKNNKITWSDEMFDILGFDKTKGAPNYEETHKELFPYDWEEYDRNKDLVIYEGKPFKQILTVKTPNGVFKKVACKVNCEKDVNGKAVKLFGIVQDITDLI